MTVEEFSQLIFSDTEHFELVEGQLVPMSSATPLHSMIRRRIERRLEEYLERTKLGDVFDEVDCALSSNTVRRPDVAIFLADRAMQIDLRTIPIPFPPDIALEVISPSELAVNVNRKALDYLRAGTQEVWLLDPENGEIFVQTDTGMRLLRGTEALDSPLLPGFSVPVTELLG
jgi:Uma2 family endonuclease